MDHAPSEPTKTLTPHPQDLALSEFFTHSLTGMARVSPSGRFLAFNDAFQAMFGYSREELANLTALEITHPDDRELSSSFSRAVWKDRESQVPGTMEKRYICKDGSVLHAEVHLTTIVGANGEPKHTLAQVVSIEERWHRRRVEAAHSRVLRLLAEDLPLAAIVSEILLHSEQEGSGLRAMLLLANESGTHFGRCHSRSLPQSFTAALEGSEILNGRGSCATGIHRGERVVVEDVFADPLWAGFEELAKDAKIASCWSQPVIGAEGSRLGSLALLSSTPRRPGPAETTFIEGMANLAAIAVERHRAIEALRISRARFKTLVEHAPEAVLLYDCESCRFVEANEQVRGVFKRSPEELLSSNPLEFSPPLQPDGRPSQEFIREKIESAKAGQPTVFDWILLDSKGDQIHCEVRLVRLPTKVGTLLRGSVINVNARRQAERELRAAKESLRATLDSIGDAVVAVDSNHCITHFNPVAARLIGCSQETAVGLKLEEVLALLDPVTREPLDPFARGSQSANHETHVILASDTGPDVFVSDRVTPIRSRDGRVTGTVFVFRDVTKQRVAQERMLQARKLEAIGQLAGGVAHDFNNLLTGILGNAELLSHNTEAKTQRSASLISLAARRAADLTDQLLRFSRKEPTRRELINLHDLIQEACDLLEHSMDKRIELCLKLEATHATISGDPSQLQNVFLNLGLNARDALDGRGSITITSRDLQSSPPSIEIAFTDTGTGIAPEIQEHIFEPFFTTKEVGTGTGLGLASTYGVVNSHGGTVRVESKPGEGASFTITLPLDETAQPPQPSALHELPHRSGTVLVVDDEDLVRGFLINALKTLGYHAVGAADGIEAEKLMAPDAFDLVILDLVMPKRSGLETFHVLTEIDPDIPILIASGYSRDHTVEAVIEAGAVGFLHKPFEINELATAVGEAMRARRPN